MKSYHADVIKSELAMLDYKEEDLTVITKDATYYYDEEKETIVKQIEEKKEELGCGKIVIKSSYKKATKTQKEHIAITVELITDYQKDYEIIPHTKDEVKNQKNIDEFIEKYVTKPFVLLENKVGVEVNFNKIFYKPQKLREIEEIIADLKQIDSALEKLEKEFVV
jgi:type I restriction enzyme M protein